MAYKDTLIARIYASGDTNVINALEQLTGVHRIAAGSMAKSRPVSSFGIKLYPNPNNGVFFLDFGDTFTGLLSVENPLGQLLFSKSVNAVGESLSLSHLPDGNYFLHLVSAETNERFKFTILH